MSYFEIYLIGVILAFALTIFLIEVSRKDIVKYSFGAKVSFVILFSIFSWIYLIAMSADMLGKKLKSKGK